MNTRFSLKTFIPSKTFLLGEYLALQNGEALIATTQPYFECTFKIASQHTVKGISSQSPAGLFIQEHIQYFDKTTIDFIDPHLQGGFGASTAQFIAVYNYLNWQLKQPEIIPTKIENPTFKSNRHSCASENSPFASADSFAVLDSYYNYAWNGQGLRPSGCDVVAQCSGNLCRVNTQLKEIQNLTWPWEDIGFALLATGYKLPTHQHLQQLEALPKNILEIPFYEALEALDNHNFNSFILAVRRYQKMLYQLNLVHPRTLTLLNLLQKLPSVLGAKGCGALGADVIWVTYKTVEEKTLQKILEETPLKWIATKKDLQSGYSYSD